MMNFEQQLQNEMMCAYLRNFDKCDENCQECHRALEDSEIIEMYKTAIEALEKQIPKKLEKKVYGSISNYIYYNCPTCGTLVICAPVEEVECGELWEKHLPYYCNNCGQSLDWWSEIKEEEEIDNPKRPCDIGLTYKILYNIKVPAGYCGCCPRCGSMIDDDTDTIKCHCCGQALDWSEVEE